MKKTDLKRIIRESIKELMNEQTNYPMCYACVNGIITPMPNYGAGQNYCGTHQQYGPMYTNPASLNNCSVPQCHHCQGGTVTSGPAHLNMNSYTYFVPGQGGVSVCYTDVNGNIGIPGFENVSDAQASCGGGGEGCTLSDFENAANPHLSQAPAPHANNMMMGWVQMFYNKWVNHPKGCEKFLPKRLQIQQQKLQQLQGQNSNPVWQQVLQAKIAAMQAIIAACCGKE